MSVQASDIQRLATALFPQVLQIRRQIHSNPELAFEEVATAGLVKQVLEEAGIPFKDGIAKTGVVGQIEGELESDAVIALRADLDALPILEENDVPYKSRQEGRMHACGHDVHTACLLGAAMILQKQKSLFGGTIKLIFQPSEEKLPGGAKVMIEEKVLENPRPSSIIGQHVFPDMEVGKVGFKPGIYMASTDEIYITIRGKGGHAALPQTTVDPIMISAYLISALQQIVSRNADQKVPTVLSISSIHGGTATNIIPDEVEMSGTLRTFDENWREQAHQRIRDIAKGVANSFGGEAEVRIEQGYPFLVNDEELTRRSKEAAIEYMGAENVVDLPLRMTAEDFAYYSQIMPGCFYRLGTANKAEGIVSALHTSTFNIDERALEHGMGLMAWLALKELSHIGA